MNGLSKQEFDRLAAGMKARKRLMMDEIRAVSSAPARRATRSSRRGGRRGRPVGRRPAARRAGRRGHARRGRGARHRGAEARIAAGRYGLCTDCGAEIGYARLQAFPTAKRCIGCQENREKTKASPPRGTR
jgi:DnaK suppressor protein